VAAATAVGKPVTGLEVAALGFSVVIGLVRAAVAGIRGVTVEPCAPIGVIKRRLTVGIAVAPRALIGVVEGVSDGPGVGDRDHTLGVGVAVRVGVAVDVCVGAAAVGVAVEGTLQAAVVGVRVIVGVGVTVASVPASTAIGGMYWLGGLLLITTS
jgi:hypothetical protein